VLFFLLGTRNQNGVLFISEFVEKSIYCIAHFIIGTIFLYVQASRNLRCTGNDSVYVEALLNDAKKRRYDRKRLPARRKALMFHI